MSGAHMYAGPADTRHAGLHSAVESPRATLDRSAVGVAAVRRREPWLATVQQVLDAMPGAAAFLTPVRDRAGRLADLVVAAVTPEAVTSGGRRGAQLVGTRVALYSPETVASDRWPVYQWVLDTGEPATLGPFDHTDGRYSVRVRRLGDGLLMTWFRHDVPAQADRGVTTELRLAQVERELAEHRRDLAAEHEMAARLQHIILPIPEGPIELPGLRVAVRYLPAGQQSRVGGDWYHAAALPDGSVLLAVGDVAGHGTPAATFMAQLRHALRALAVTTTDPAQLLGHLNRLTCDLEREAPEISATAVIARYEPQRRRLTWAQAGHPPPVFSHAGRAAALDRPPGPVLGVVEDARYANATLELDFGDMLLFYTDGLIEHRHRSLDEGLQAVIDTVDEAVASSSTHPLIELFDRFRRPNPEDDTCILAIRPLTGLTRDLRRFAAPQFLPRPPR
ncbi:PP2C family protein-serine/threonine phosphatase [Krasilnikovia sp. MM14-A1259]|uniref:PP2C family protein-serine/threonine phosphatase n=1 Tax=Krasilnikovia sp. MM14-A1259 TaxID=3373539 RepID=UPI003824A450